MRSILLFILVSLLSCNPGSGDWDILIDGAPDVYTSGPNASEQYHLPKIWFEGKAEVSTYTLTQNRYNDLHKGEVVQIFVTEDFLTDKQVKNDSYTNNNYTSILKNNSMRTFTTGVYDYSMYTSVFTDIKSKNGAETLKATMSSQDWCGQSFLQLNNRKNKYHLKAFSYFESEGDQTKEIAKALLLDEVFNLIRINPQLLPVGDIKVIPSMIYSRLKHQELHPVSSTASLQNYKGTLVEGENLMSYTINIPSCKASFEFIFANNMTREILAWTEKYPSAFDGQLRQTVAVRKAVEWMPYWEKNDVKDGSLRSRLLLGASEN